MSEAGELPRAGRLPGIGTGVARGRRRGYFFLGGLAADFAALWQSRISRGTTRSGDSRREAVSGGLCAEAGRHRPHVLRRRRDPFLLSPRGRQERHFPCSGGKQPGISGAWKLEKKNGKIEKREARLRPREGTRKT